MGNVQCVMYTAEGRRAQQDRGFGGSALTCVACFPVSQVHAQLIQCRLLGGQSMLQLPATSGILGIRPNACWHATERTRADFAGCTKPQSHTAACQCITSVVHCSTARWRLEIPHGGRICGRLGPVALLQVIETVHDRGTLSHHALHLHHSQQPACHPSLTPGASLHARSRVKFLPQDGGAGLKSLQLTSYL
jgi:hypothetical protein